MYCFCLDYQIKTRTVSALSTKAMRVAFPHLIMVHIFPANDGPPCQNIAERTQQFTPALQGVHTLCTVHHYPVLYCTLCSPFCSSGADSDLDFHVVKIYIRLLRIRDVSPGSRILFFYPSRIPDPGAKGTGSQVRTRNSDIYLD